MPRIARPRSFAPSSALLPAGIGTDVVWQVFLAAERGEVTRLRALIDREPRLVSADIEGTYPLHIAVREGHEAAVHMLLDAGANPGIPTSLGEPLIDVARMRGYRRIQRVLKDSAAIGPSPSPRDVWRSTFEPVDFALWSGPTWNPCEDRQPAQFLPESETDLVIAAAVGNLERVAILLSQGAHVDAPRPSGKRALSSAVQFEHDSVAFYLLDRGADPNAPEGRMAPRGSALYAASRRGDHRLVSALLNHGADPNAVIEASGSATYIAATPAIRAKLVAAGGVLDPYDWVWLENDEKALQLISEDPNSANRGCGSVFAALCTLGRRELMERILQLGVRPPSRIHGCGGYLLERPDMLERLIHAGLSPDLADWQHTTLLHQCCARDSRGRARPERLASAQILLDAGATVEARDAALRSRPLAWASRNGLAGMVELLLRRGARAGHAEDPPWATPRAWAVRSGFAPILKRLDNA